MIETPISLDLFKQSMRLLAGGVCIVATNHNGMRHGLTVTAVCSLTADPPSLAVCINQDAGAHAAIASSKRVSINVLSCDQIELAGLFSSATVKGSERFEEAQWAEMASGLPALIDALAVLDCEIIQEAPIGQHTVFFCEVKATRLQPHKAPLVHFNRTFSMVQSIP